MVGEEKKEEEEKWRNVREKENEKSKGWRLQGKRVEGGGIKWRRHGRAIPHSWVPSTKFPTNHAVILNEPTYLYFLTKSFNHNILLYYATTSTLFSPTLHKYV